MSRALLPLGVRRLACGRANSQSGDMRRDLPPRPSSSAGGSTGLLLHSGSRACRQRGAMLMYTEVLSCRYCQVCSPLSYTSQIKLHNSPLGKQLKMKHAHQHSNARQAELSSHTNTSPPLTPMGSVLRKSILKLSSLHFPFYLCFYQ